MSVSEPTAYRRLNALEDAGLVVSRTVRNPDGNHYRQFSAVFEGATVSLGDGEFSIDVDTATGTGTGTGTGA